MTNVLITGGNGQLATCIKDLENQYDNLNVIYTDYLELDICDLDQVKDFFKLNELDYCINCAAFTAVDKAETEVERAFQVNTLGVKNLALACTEYKVNLIHISTDFVFDGKKNEPYTESDSAKPISVYGASKLQGEVEIQQILKEYFIIRTSWLYSEHGNNFMKTMLKLSKDRDEISVVSDQIGVPTYARDLAVVLYKIITTKCTNFGTYHYSNQGVASWHDFARTIFNIKKIKTIVNSIDTTDYPTPAKRPQFSVLDTSKIKGVLKIEIPIWQDSLRKALSRIQ